MFQSEKRNFHCSLLLVIFAADCKYYLGIEFCKYNAICDLHGLLTREVWGTAAETKVTEITFIYFISEK